MIFLILWLIGATACGFFIANEDGGVNENNGPIIVFSLLVWPFLLWLFVIDHVSHQITKRRNK